MNKHSIFRKNHFLSRAGILSMLMLCSFFVQAQKASKPVWYEKGGNKGFTFYEVQEDFNQYWKDRKVEKGQGYKAFKRWENYMTPRVYPSGNMSLPSSTYANFMEWQRNTPASRSLSGNWSPLGPLTKPTGYDAGDGLVKFVRFDPNNSEIMYVGTPDGGLWKTSNGGASWETHNTDFLPVIGCSDLAIDPTNTQIMYLATGNWDGGKKSIGILKSDDGGLTWNPTGLNWTVADNYIITKLVMQPSNPSIMFITTDGGVLSTTDGWQTFSNPLCCVHLDDIKFKPGDPNTIYAAGSEFWKSTDNGITWNNVSTGFPAAADISRTALGVSEANPAVVYALVGDNTGAYLGTFKSTDSGTSFTLQSSSPNLLQADKNGVGTGGQATHDMAIAVSPADENLLIIGGVNQWGSINGGVDWNIVSYWLGNDNNYPGVGDAFPDYVHADIQSIQYQPGSSTTLFATCDGGISKSTDNGAHWTDLSHNLSIAQQTGIALSASDPGIMVTGLQDIGTLKNEAGAWSVINGGDGEDAFIDRTSNNFIVTSNPRGAHALSTDGGLSKADITGLPAGQWFSPISQDPGNVDLVYAGGRPKLWKTLDLFSVGASCTWTELGAPTGSGNIIQFVVAPSSTDRIYAIKYDAFSVSTDAGDTWEDKTGSLPVANASLTDLTISDTDPLKVWVTFSGYEAGNKVFQTTDGGDTWTNISAGLPNLPINTIVAVNGSPTDAVYIGADIGIYYLDNTLTEFLLFNTNLPNVTVTDLEIYYPGNLIRASTYGRGAWESDLYDSGVGTQDIGDHSDIRLIPNPASDLLQVLGTNTENTTIRVIDVFGRSLHEQKLNQSNQIKISDLPDGIYFMEILWNNRPLVTKRFVKA